MLCVHASSAALVPMLFLTQYRKDLFSFLGLKSVFMFKFPPRFSFLMSRSMTLVLRERLCCSESVLTNHTRLSVTSECICMPKLLLFFTNNIKRNLE